MPKCTVCSKLFHPDWVISVDKGIYKCMFCQTDKKELTVQNEETGKPLYTVTKEQAIKDYDIFVKKVLEKETVQKLIKGEKVEKKK